MRSHAVNPFLKMSVSRSSIFVAVPQWDFLDFGRGESLFLVILGARGHQAAGLDFDSGFKFSILAISWLFAGYCAADSDLGQ